MPEHTPPGFREYIDYRIWDLERQERVYDLIRSSGDDDDELHVPDDIDDLPEYDPEVEDDDVLDEDELLAQ
jgi:hypothetical protein